jgi:hypothetical protein
MVRHDWQTLKIPTWSIPIALLLLCAISYGSMSSRLGFFWDDWSDVYVIHFLGPSVIRESAALDRPVSGWIFQATTSLIGESPLNWQLFGIITRWLLCLTLWWALKAVWSQKTLQVTAITFLFAVYPGFQQQYIAITWSNWFIVYALFLISLGAMSWALRKSRWFWPFYFLSIILGGYTVFAVEYFFGLEFLRPLFLWLILSESISEPRKRACRVGWYWMPFVVIDLVFLIYRISTPTPRGVITITELAASPIREMLNLGQMVIQDLFKVTALAWKQTLDLTSLSSYGSAAILKYILILTVTTVFIILFLLLLRSGDKHEINSTLASRRQWAVRAILVAFYALLVAGVPVWMTNMRMELTFPYDRFTLSMMLGCSLLFVGLIELVTRTRFQSILIVGIAVGLAAAIHYQVALKYRQDWLLQQDFFWQLTWRIPQLQPGTVILVSELPFPYNTDNSLTAPTNWIYDPEKNSREINYLLLDFKRLSLEFPDLDEKSLENYRNIRIITFNGSISQTLFIVYQPPGCLKVVDSQTYQHLPNKPRFYREALSLSMPELILPDAYPAAQPPAYFFGPEPKKNWCYYFEKAELARQINAWDQVTDLGDQALKDHKKFNRNEVVELVPFIQGYAHTGRWDRALELSLEAYDTWDNTRLLLCDAWHNIHQTATIDLAGLMAFDKIQEKLQCTSP